MEIEIFISIFKISLEIYDSDFFSKSVYISPKYCSNIKCVLILYVFRNDTVHGHHTHKTGEHRIN